MALRRVLVLATVATFVLAACQPAAAPTEAPVVTSTPAAPATPEPATPEPATPEPPATASPEPASPSPAAGACTPQDPNLKNAGRLTIATDNPAFPPYFDPPAEGEEPASPANQDDPWALGDPTNKRGFEAAVAWEIADRLGFADDEVDWIFVAWDNLWAPGPKEFDFGLAQISFTEERAQQVDMSEAYYFVNQSLVAPLGNPLLEATTMDEIRQHRLGAQIGTTSLRYIEDVIQPETPASVYQDNTAAIAGLVADQIDGIVVDLPTAFFITAVQLEEAGIGGEIVGIFPAPEDSPEYFSIVLEQNSLFTDCVNEAIAGVSTNGTLDAITEQWLTGQADAPIIEP
jgi:polar amino acid transport system substrate-binding protein